MARIRPKNANEARQYYNSYKNKYYNAYNQKQASIRDANNYINQRYNCYNKLNETKAQKLNLEKRVNGIVEIINYLKNTTNSIISTSNNALKNANEKYACCIKATGTTKPSNFESIFKTLAVESQTNSSIALNEYIRIKNETEAEIAKLKNQINNLNSEISNLNNSINQCYSNQRALQAKMNSYSYEMIYYKEIFLKFTERR